LVEDFGDGGVGESLPVHLLAVSAPGGVEVDEIEFFAYLGLGGLLDGVPLHLGVQRSTREYKECKED
jgi:hypothetical protein